MVVILRREQLVGLLREMVVDLLRILIYESRALLPKFNAWFDVSKGLS